MKIAIEEGKKAGQIDEVPIGAVLVAKTCEVIATAHNQMIRLSDPTAHAEILALRSAGRISGNYRLAGTTLYITVEPCVMCMGAIINARIYRVVFGAKDPKWGAAGSLYDFASDRRFNHHPEIIGGICEEECKRLMQEFFKQRR
ncbi:MAG: nucleoside deaminase [Deltaproteobacteria bacterium]|nr:nucleoside deaminase [Deltaproteobacteria bacterium]MBW1962153.1 nucleoside deaminase [Deltaproteobacteria bacterium]MBW1994648.1 nucleoside deaminase [Deltaproteobacteria bacterium]MBW2150281.1 nucleoside deaminase [Deltaproteobacteria bacterium]